MKSNDKIQHLLITHLLEKGSVELTLPDGMVVEIGITAENARGDLEKLENYCWMIASQSDRTVSIDSYNLGLRFSDDQSKIIVEEAIVDHEGQNVKVLDVI